MRDELDATPPSDRSGVAHVEAYANAIGQLVIQWNMLDTAVSRRLWKLIGLNDVLGASLTSRLPQTSDRIDTLISWCRERGASRADAKVMNQLLHVARDLENRFHQLTHDPWCVDPHTGRLSQIQTTGERIAKIGTAQEQLYKLRKTTREVEACCTHFEQAVEALLKVVKPVRATFA